MVSFTETENTGREPGLFWSMFEFEVILRYPSEDGRQIIGGIIGAQIRNLAEQSENIAGKQKYHF